MWGDSGDPSGVGAFTTVGYVMQFVMGLTHRTARDKFLVGGDENFQYILDQNPRPQYNSGNSIEDLRLSYSAWHFGKMIQNGEITSLEEVANWISENIAETN
jgi:hypothetical protein